MVAKVASEVAVWGRGVALAVEVPVLSVLMPQVAWAVMAATV